MYFFFFPKGVNRWSEWIHKNTFGESNIRDEHQTMDTMCQFLMTQINMHTRKY